MYAAPMACRASSPRLPSAARWNSSSVSRKQRLTVALKSSFFVPKRRKRYGWEMPARRAMSSVDVPSSPRSANSTRAASRTSSFRSAAESLTAMCCMLVMTHKFVKCGRHPVEVARRQPAVQRQCERPLEGSVGAGERPLVAVRPELVQRIRADLAADALAAQAGHHLVAAVDLDDVGLPAVPVAVVRLRQNDVEVGEPLRIAGGDRLPACKQLAEPAHLRDAERAQHVADPVVERGRRHVGVCV